LKASAHLLNIDFSELNQIAPDNLLASGVDNKFSPNFGAGIYYHTKKFYAGLSVPRFLQTTHFESGTNPSANFMFNDKLVLGAAYRLDAAVSGMAGFYVSESFFAGVAYDREISELGNAVFNNGSFEVILRYDFVKKTGILKSPRFF